jgi:hypothetical protein
VLGLAAALTQEERQGVCSLIESVNIGVAASECANVEKCCAWKGFGCELGHVTSLSLSIQMSEGSLPSEIGLLSFLVSLNIVTYRKVVMSELGRLTLLRSLVIRSYSGPFTFPQLENLVSLQYLEIFFLSLLLFRSQLSLHWYENRVL